MNLSLEIIYLDLPKFLFFRKFIRFIRNLSYYDKFQGISVDKFSMISSHIVENILFLYLLKHLFILMDL